MKTTIILLSLCLSTFLAIAQEADQARLLTSGYKPQSVEEAATTLTATNKVGASSSVEYKAGQAVILQPGFEARAGAVFTAHIGEVSVLASANSDGKGLTVTAYPNPFEAVTTISYVLARPGQTSLHVRDTEGRLLTQLVDNQYQEAGPHQLEWKGGHLPAGTYVYTLEAGTQQLSKRIIKK
ncbi:hypothetical protein BH09BAC4_BH09BAC4_06320 [soil metagenome]